MAVVEELTAGQPGRFVLEQNYPNTFNSATTIRFALPENREAGLEIFFNLMG